MGVVTDAKEIVMQKSKSGSSSAAAAASSSSSNCTTAAVVSKGGRLNPRKIWTRSRSKSHSRVNTTAIWTPQGGSVWTCPSTGRQVCLTDGHLLSLSDVEAVALRHVALARLQGMDLGCAIAVPKASTSDNAAAEKPKRRALILKRRAATTGFLDGNKDNNVHAADSCGRVFGVPLVKCVNDERASRRSVSAPLRDVANLLVAHLKTGSASAEDITNERLLASRRYLTSSRSSCNIPLEVAAAVAGQQRGTPSVNENIDGSSVESLNSVCKSRSVSGLSMLDEFQNWAACEPEPDPLVPNIVNTCFRHIECYGLHKLGIFRVSSSKKRVRQLREDFDSGKEMQLSEDHCPHDVATLLKEYFRDLPEPLLTRDLYLAFVATQRIRNRRQQLDSLRHLIQLLPTANRDTLWALLRFLAKVATYAEDQRSESGEWVAGNKMDANNLATLFGPNILHMAKPTTMATSGCSTYEYQVESVKRADERIEVIKAVRTMIDNYRELYEVPSPLMDDIYRRLLKHHPEELGRLLQGKLLPLEIEMDPDPDTGSSACSETASVAHLAIEAAMEVTPLVISLATDQSRGQGASKSAGNDQESNYRRGSGSSSGGGGRTDRGGSVGREVFAKTESVASRLFRRRDKSAVRGVSGEENRERRSSREGGKSDSESTSSRWFRRKDRDFRDVGGAATVKMSTDEKKKKLKSEVKDQKIWNAVSRESFSEGSGGGGSDSRSSSLKSASVDSMKSLTRPLMLQEVMASQQHQQQQSGDTADDPQQQVSVVDIRKKHLNVQDGGERRLSTSDVEVITASLTLKVPLARSQTGPALAFGQDAPLSHDIPYIEDVAVAVQPESPSVDSKSSSSFHVGRHRYLDRRHKSSPFFQKESSGTGDPVRPSMAAATMTTRTRQRTNTSLSSPLTTSSSTSALLGGQNSENQDSRRSRASVRSSSSDDRRTSGTTANQWPQETWKRWEIISSEHTEQETVV